MVPLWDLRGTKGESHEDRTLNDLLLKSLPGDVGSRAKPGLQSFMTF